MLAVVKKPPTDFVLRGTIPEKYLTLLKNDFGKALTLLEDDDEYVLVEDMDWYKEMKAKETPGDKLRFYRKLNKMTQQQLALKLGVTKQKISNLERNVKPISRKTAYQLAGIFNRPPGYFI
ncbi:hypothetical protein AGMMS50212_12440 [Spirochaetia bacterium]|nr:hypothetical protein AGMMS50212_12440 [Spirochaetia bacterium]